MPYRRKQLITLFFTALLCIACNSNVYSQTVDLSLYDAFRDAIEMDNFSEVKQFINFGVDVNYRYDDSKTPLMIASAWGSVRVVRTLLKLGADADLKSSDKMTALDYANRGNDKFIIALLKNNSYIDKPLIKEIQFYLHKLGYNPGPVDGLLGNKTSSALKKFSRNTHKNHPAEISHRQVEILKNIYFGSDNLEPKDLAYGTTLGVS
jgi:ankyrin repeat protein